MKNITIDTLSSSISLLILHLLIQSYCPDQLQYSCFMMWSLPNTILESASVMFDPVDAMKGFHIYMDTTFLLDTASFPIFL